MTGRPQPTLQGALNWDGPSVMGQGDSPMLNGLHVERSVDVGCSLPVGAVRSGLSGSSTASRCEDQLLILEGNLGSKTQEE